MGATPQTEELAKALTESDIVKVLDAIIDPKVSPKTDKVYVDGELAKKVDKVSGKQLSTEDFTTALMTKLSTVEGSHFKGIHKDLASLESAHPAVHADAGGWAYIKNGANPEKLAMLDGGSWVEHANAGVPLTAAQIKTLYEGNANTEPFTTAEKARLGQLDGKLAINLDECILEGDRATTGDLTDPHPSAEELQRFVDNAGLRHILQAMNAPREIYALIGQNPVMKMELETGGRSAQMQVIDKEAGHAVASMEWLKTTQEFVFTLYNKDSGVVKATFEIKPDGKAYVGGKEIVTVDAITTPPHPTADGDYKLNVKAGVATWVTV